MQEAESPSEVENEVPDVDRPESGQEAADLVGEMLGEGRFGLLLRPQIANNLSDAQLDRAQNALDEAMSIVPGGDVVLQESLYEDINETSPENVAQCIDVDAFHLDRYLVTNEEYQRFVDAGGYEQVAMWDASIWAAVLEFVDLTGYPGPRFWKHGKYPKNLAKHPVVGVSWFEARAYANWVGKRLPSSPEWVKAGTWPVSTEGEMPKQRKFPWGDSMDRNLANLWGVGEEATCPVDALQGGTSVGGVMQLIGNVWEWTFSSFVPADKQLELPVPMKALHGGAFDTYFDTQATCQFKSGDSPLARKHNIGFRCALGVCDVVSAYSGLEADPDELVACGAGDEYE